MNAYALVLCLIVTKVTCEVDQHLIEANNIFTSDIYKQTIKKEKGNVLVSPISAEIVLALAQSGAKDDTAKEIQTALHLPNSDQKIQTIFKSSLLFFESNNQYSLHTANKIYVRENFSIKEDFKKIAVTTYRSEIENIDFSQSDKASSTINQWVENQTEHKIKNLVAPSSLSSGTPAIIVNALYFKAFWSTPDFHKYPITKKPFFKTSSEKKDVDFMTNWGGYYKLYKDTDLGATFLEVSFKGDDSQMVFVLPNEKEGLAKLEEHPEKIFKKHQFQSGPVNVALPLFKIETTIDFKEILQQLGVTKAFTAGEADFSNIAGNKGDLSVEEVTQKCYIDVNRDGVEAAAATNILFGLSGPPRTDESFIADHPFVFYITVKDIILFAGRVTDPNY